MSDAAAEYLREAVNTFVFGFDAACIAFCGAALEQVLGDLLVSAGIFTPARIQRERKTAIGLLEEAKRANLVDRAYDAARRVIEERNRIMHRRLSEVGTIKQVALATVLDFGEVLSTLEKREG